MDTQKLTMRLFSFLLALLLTAHFTFSCFSLSRRSEISPAACDRNRKYLDIRYVTQLDRMTRCLSDLPPHVYDRIPKFTKQWAESALTSVADTFAGTHDWQEIYKRGFLECFEIVAEERAKKFICTAFELLEGEMDKMELYAIVEYELCIEEKNRPHKKRLSFEMPQIGAVRQKPSNK